MTWTSRQEPSWEMEQTGCAWLGHTILPGVLFQADVAGDAKKNNEVLFLYCRFIVSHEGVKVPTLSP